MVCGCAVTPRKTYDASNRPMSDPLCDDYTINPAYADKSEGGAVPDDPGWSPDDPQMVGKHLKNRQTNFKKVENKSKKKLDKSQNKVGKS